MAKDFRDILTKFSEKKGWSITQLALEAEIPVADLYKCFQSDTWPQEVESKIMELYVDEIAKNSNSIQT